MSFRHIAFAFALGILLGFVLRGGNVSSIPPRKTEAPFHMSSVAETGVSHNPEIKKRVLAGYLQLPHITQVCIQGLFVEETTKRKSPPMY